MWYSAPNIPPIGIGISSVRPWLLDSAAQFRPKPPPAYGSPAWKAALAEVKRVAVERTPEQTRIAQLWNSSDPWARWNEEAAAALVRHHASDLDAARVLAVLNTAASDAIIACFDAKYHYWFWRPYQAIHQADADGNPATLADPNWLPLGTTPNFPEYPSAHACHSGAVVKALESFFGTDRMPLSLDSRITHTTTSYDRLHEVVDDVDLARVLVGFHFRSSDLTGSNLGRRVGRYVATHYFQPIG